MIHFNWHYFRCITIKGGMRKLLSLVLSTVVLAGTALAAVNFNSIYASLKSGNALELSKFFDERILLTIKGGEFNIQNTYSKAQAKGIMADFFGKSKPNKFDEKHRNDQSNKPLYRIGYLLTNKGTYRTLIRVKEKDGKLKIQEIELSLDKSAGQ